MLFCLFTSLPYTTVPSFIHEFSQTNDSVTKKFGIKSLVQYKILLNTALLKLKSS